MAKLVWFNGEISPLETASVPAADHAHLYGDGLFEGIRIYGGKIFRLDEHLERTYAGCRYLGFEMTVSQDELRKTILSVCQQAGIDDGYIRLNVTRGTGLGLDPKAVKTAPNIMIMVNELALYTPDMYVKGLDVVTAALRVIPADSLDPRIKCIGRYAGNIMAKLEANKRGAGEALMLNQQGHIAECTGDNIFLIKDGVIHTPHPSCGILQGITRDTCIALARESGYKVTEDILTIFDVHNCDEAFLTGTAAEVIFMRSLDDRLIGDGTMGPITKHITELYRAETKNGVPFSTTEKAPV